MVNYWKEKARAERVWRMKTYPRILPKGGRFGEEIGRNAVKKDLEEGGGGCANWFRRILLSSTIQNEMRRTKGSWSMKNFYTFVYLGEATARNGKNSPSFPDNLLAGGGKYLSWNLKSLHRRWRSCAYLFFRISWHFFRRKMAQDRKVGGSAVANVSIAIADNLSLPGREH